MSHFTVMVIGENPEDQLAPFQENNMSNCPEEYLEFNDETEILQKEWESLSEDEKNEYDDFESFVGDRGYDEHEGKFGYWENPNAKWDWYVLGGRWTGFFKMKPGHKGESGRGGLFTPPPASGTADSALKKDIDFREMRRSAGEEAGKTWDKVMKIVGNLKDYATWEYVRDTISSGDIDAAREYYANQKAVVKLNEYNRKKSYKMAFINLDDFVGSREDYCIDAANSSFVTFAVIKDGVWYEKGSMGWWGMVSNEKNQDDWNSEVSKMIDELPEDTLISVYDCHI
jgi:hypothetical protein